MFPLFLKLLDEQLQEEFDRFLAGETPDDLLRSQGAARRLNELKRQLTSSGNR